MRCGWPCCRSVSLPPYFPSSLFLRSHLDLKIPHDEHTADIVAAPQQLAPKVTSYLEFVSHEAYDDGGRRTVPMLGRASSGIDSNAPMSGKQYSIRFGGIGEVALLMVE